MQNFDLIQQLLINNDKIDIIAENLINNYLIDDNIKNDNLNLYSTSLDLF